MARISFINDCNTAYENVEQYCKDRNIDIKDYIKKYVENFMTQVKKGYSLDDIVSERMKLWDSNFMSYQLNIGGRKIYRENMLDLAKLCTMITVYKDIVK